MHPRTNARVRSMMLGKWNRVCMHNVELVSPWCPHAVCAAASASGMRLSGNSMVTMLCPARGPARGPALGVWVRMSRPLVWMW